MLSSYEDNAIIIAGDFNADTVNPNNKRSLGYLKNFLRDTGYASITEDLACPGAFTYRSDNGLKTSCIDGFLIQRTILCQVSTLTIGPDTPQNTSDHQPVRIQWNYAFQEDTYSKQKPTTSSCPAQSIQRLKINWSLATNEEIEAQYTAPLEGVSNQLFISLYEYQLDDNKVDEILQSLTAAMLQLSLGLPHSYPTTCTRKQGKPEWNHDTKVRYTTSLQAWKSWKMAGNPHHGPLYQQYLQSKKDFRRQLRQSRAINHRKLLHDIENASEKDQHLFHKLIRKQRPTNTTRLTTETLKYDDKTYQGDTELMTGWHHYFKDLSLPPSAEDLMSCPDTPKRPAMVQPRSTTPTITSYDLKQAITNLKKGKASGPDNISSEHLIHIGNSTVHLIVLIYNYYLSTRHISHDLKKGLILPFHKGKGKDAQDPRNYRGITLTSAFSKLLELVLKPNLEKSLKASNIPDEMQFGFQKNHSCIMTSCTLELVIESNTSRKRTTYVALLDAEKAFDTVWHEGLFHKLDETDIDPAHSALLKSLYENLESQVFWKGKASETIPILQGVRQGGVLSPLLYNVFIDGLIKSLKEKNLGCHLFNHYAGVIVLADDVALVSTSPSDLQEMLNITHEYTKTWRYRINPTKSSIVIFNDKTHNPSPPHSWTLGSEPIHLSKQHPHLGILKSSSRHDPTDQIIMKGTKTFYAMTGAGAYTGGLLPHHCARLWKVYCIPRMLYGVAIARLTQVMRRKLDRAQHQLFKKVLGLPNSAADEAVYLLTGLIPLSMQVDLDTLLVIGQIINLPHSRYEVRTLLHAITQSTPMMRAWENILSGYKLPDLHSLISKPFPYVTWKSTAKQAVKSVLQDNIQDALNTKSSLSFFSKDAFAPQELYPTSCSSSFLRQAVIIRSQLATQTYLTQLRLSKLKKSSNKTCQLCKEEDEDTIHFIAKCPQLKSHRQVFLDALHKLGTPRETLTPFQSDPLTFTQAVLLPSIILASPHYMHAIITATLSYLYNVHSSRAIILSSCSTCDS